MQNARSLTDELMDCVDRLGAEFDAVDPRVWDHLLVYAPKDTLQRHQSDTENAALRAVYEASRRFMRFNGVDRAKMLEALEQLDNAIATVQQIDSGLTDDD